MPFGLHGDSFSLTVMRKKRFIKHQKTTVSFLVMASANAAEAVIFLHLPKTADTTLNRLIEWEYPLFEMYSIDPVFFRWSGAHSQKVPERRLKRTRVFKGHMWFRLHEILPQPATCITVLREPVDRVVPAFYFTHNYKSVFQTAINKDTARGQKEMSPVCNRRLKSGGLKKLKK
jgi:hypothetical protein